MSTREDRRNERRTAILETASQFFMDHGYGGTTMSAVAAELGGSKATLWSYFSSKEDLFAACIENRVEAFRLQLVSLLDPAAPLRPAIERFCRSFITKIREPHAIALYQLLCGEGARTSEPGRIFFERGPGTVEALLTAFLSGHVEKGRLHGGTPREMAQVLISLCTGVTHQQLLLGLAPTTAPAPAPKRQTDLFFRLYGATET